MGRAGHPQTRVPQHLGGRRRGGQPPHGAPPRHETHGRVEATRVEVPPLGAALPAPVAPVTGVPVVPPKATAGRRAADAVVAVAEAEGRLHRLQPPLPRRVTSQLLLREGRPRLPRAPPLPAARGRVAGALGAVPAGPGQEVGLRRQAAPPAVVAAVRLPPRRLLLAVTLLQPPPIGPPPRALLAPRRRPPGPVLLGAPAEPRVTALVAQTAAVVEAAPAPGGRGVRVPLVGGGVAGPARAVAAVRKRPVAAGTVGVDAGTAPRRAAAAIAAAEARAGPAAGGGAGAGVAAAAVRARAGAPAALEPLS